MAELNYTTRSIRQRGAEDMWEVTLSHRNPLTGEVVRARARAAGDKAPLGCTYYKVEAKTRKQAERKRDELILELERKGGALATGVTVREFMDRFVDCKEESGTIEPSTVRGYRSEAKLICKYIGSEKLVSVTIATVNDWMARMTRDGYAPKSVAKLFRLLKQAMKWAVAQDLIVKNPCDFCKPPKTSSSRRTIPPTAHTFQALKAMRAESRRKMAEFGLSGDPYILGTQEPDSRPYNPTQLGMDFAAFCKMNGFACTFHDLRHTFATMMVAGGNARFARYVRTVSSYLGHASVSMTLNIYADVDPDAKKAAVSKVQDCFDMDFGLDEGDDSFAAPQPAPGVAFTVEQLEAMLAQARAQQAAAV